MAMRSRRRALHRQARVGATVVCLGVLAVGLPGCVTMDSATGSPSASPSLAPAPPKQPPPQMTQAQVEAALSRLDGLVENAMRQTGVPGVAVAVVHRDKVVYAKGFGVRQLGKNAKVDPTTVFQLASLSKPLSSTIVARAVGRQSRRLGRPGGHP